VALPIFYLPRRLPPLPAGWERAASPAELASTVLASMLVGADDDGGHGAHGADDDGAHDAHDAHDVERTGIADALADALDFPWPVTPLSDERYLLELFHGPTAAFKDVGARALARLMDREMERRGERAWIVVATSGDTGSAV